MLRTTNINSIRSISCNNNNNNNNSPSLLSQKKTISFHRNNYNYNQFSRGFRSYTYRAQFEPQNEYGSALGVHIPEETGIYVSSKRDIVATPSINTSASDRYDTQGFIDKLTSVGTSGRVLLGPRGWDSRIVSLEAQYPFLVRRSAFLATHDAIRIDECATPDVLVSNIGDSVYQLNVANGEEAEVALTSLGGIHRFHLGDYSNSSNSNNNSNIINHKNQYKQITVNPKSVLGWNDSITFRKSSSSSVTATGNGILLVAVYSEPRPSFIQQLLRIKKYFQ